MEGWPEADFNMHGPMQTHKYTQTAHSSRRIKQAQG